MPDKKNCYTIFYKLCLYTFVLKIIIIWLFDTILQISLLQRHFVIVILGEIVLYAINNIEDDLQLSLELGPHCKNKCFGILKLNIENVALKSALIK